MRLNQFIASATGMSRRAADQVISDRRVQVNGVTGTLGQAVDPASDQVKLNCEPIKLPEVTTIIFNKPAGLVTSRSGQSNPTIYDVLPVKFQNLKPAGRLDRDSQGLLVLTNDGRLANRLMHPSAGKVKRYRVTLDRPLDDGDGQRLDEGIGLSEGISRIKLVRANGATLTIELVTGWNRQIRRSFETLHYEVRKLERIEIGSLKLGGLKPGQWRQPTPEEVKWLTS